LVITVVVVVVVDAGVVGLSSSCGRKVRRGGLDVV
jgi:hypothetical protein